MGVVKITELLNYRVVQSDGAQLNFINVNLCGLLWLSILFTQLLASFPHATIINLVNISSLSFVVYSDDFFSSHHDFIARERAAVHKTIKLSCTRTSNYEFNVNAFAFICPHLISILHDLLLALSLRDWDSFWQHNNEMLQFIVKNLSFNNSKLLLQQNECHHSS